MESPSKPCIFAPKVEKRSQASLDGTKIVGNLISILPTSLVGHNSLCRLEWGPKAEAKSLLVCPGWLACKCEVCSRKYNAVWNTSVGTPYLNKLCAYCVYYAHRCSSMPSRMIMHHLQKSKSCQGVQATKCKVCKKCKHRKFFNIGSFL